MRTILLTHALSFEDRELHVVDLVLAGVLGGIWLPFEALTAAAVGAETELDSRGEGPSRDEVADAARTYRYDRNLIARVDLDAWLAARGLTTSDWRGHLRRTLAAARAPGSDAGDATPVLRVDALCSGTLLRCAQRLIAGAAAARHVEAIDIGDEDATAALVAAARRSSASGLDTIADEELERRARVVARLDRAHALLAAEVASTDALARRITSHALDWLTFDTEELAVASDDAGREARLCVQEDGLSFAEVAAVAGGAATRVRRIFADTPPELGTALVSAAPGQIVGPLPVGGTHVVTRVLHRAPPSPEDAAVVERARDELVTEAVERLAAGRVTWHVGL